jgi:general secretion pathway protein H
VLGLVAGIVLPRAARAPGPIELRAAAEEIAALLRSDRNSAIRERREVLSQIDVAEGVVASTSLQRAVRVPPGVRIEFVQSSNEVRDGGEGGIRFLPDGRSSGGALSLQRDDALYRISVNWLTGSVLVSAPDT